MSKFVAKRIRFRNGERISVVARPLGLPVHEATLYLERYRKRGRAANTLHSTCSSLALMYRELSKLGIDPAERVRSGSFLTVPELSRLADAAQRRVDDLSEEGEEQDKPNVIDIRRIRTRLKAKSAEVVPVDVGTQATRLRQGG